MSNYWELWSEYLFEPLKPDVNARKYWNLITKTYDKTKDSIASRFLGFFLLLLLGTIGLVLLIAVMIIGFGLIISSYILWIAVYILLMVIGLVFIWLIWIISGKEGLNSAESWLNDDIDSTFTELRDYLIDLAGQLNPCK